MAADPQGGADGGEPGAKAAARAGAETGTGSGAEPAPPAVPPPRQAGDRPAEAPMPRAVGTMAFAASLAAANVHYSQPLIPTFAAALSVSTGAAGAVPAVTQVGFAVGLVAILPLGDMLERRRLGVTTLLLVSAGLAGMARAPNLPLLLVAAFLVGLTTVSPQLLAPFAADIAPPTRRGQASGLVLSGILFGVLLSKVVAGAVTDTAGFRWLYGGAAAAMLILAAVLRRALPAGAHADPPRYGELMRSTAALWRELPALRRHALLGGITFAVFMAFWTTYAVHLEEQFGYGPAVAGLFALTGIVGSLSSPLAGRAVDRGGFRPVVTLAMGIMALAFAVMFAGQASTLALLAGVLALDAGNGLSHAANQSAAMALAPDRRSRINSVYMCGYFAGGALGTVVASTVLALGGWSAVCALGFGLSLLGALVLRLAR